PPQPDPPDHPHLRRSGALAALADAEPSPVRAVLPRAAVAADRRVRRLRRARGVPRLRDARDARATLVLVDDRRILQDEDHDIGRAVELIADEFREGFLRV